MSEQETDMADLRMEKVLLVHCSAAKSVTLTLDCKKHGDCLLNFTGWLPNLNTDVKSNERRAAMHHGSLLTKCDFLQPLIAIR